MKQKWIFPKLLAVMAIIFGGNWALQPALSPLPENVQRILFTMVIPYCIFLPVSCMILRTMEAVPFETVSPYGFLKLCRTALIMMGVTMPVIGILTVLKTFLGNGSTPDFSGIRRNLGFYTVLFLVFNPIFEEILFRNLIFRLLRPFGDQKAILFSAGFFAAPHLFSQGLPQMCGMFLLGMVLADTVKKSGRLLEAILLHSFFNLYGVFLPLLLTKTEAGSCFLVLLNLTVIVSGISLAMRDQKRKTGLKAQNTAGKAKNQA